MLLFITSASIRRAVGSNGPCLVSAFLTNNAPLSPSVLAPPQTSLSLAITKQTSSSSWKQTISSARFMSAEAPPTEEKTEEEKAAIKAAREERK